ncbi:unnamed protein product, partial [marine sediment metagenome]
FHCPGEPGCPMLQNDIWYDWTASCSGEATITTCDANLSPEDQPNTAMVVYDGCNCPVESEKVIDCSHFAGGDCGLSSEVIFDAVAGHCYKIRLGGHLGGEPSGNLTITCEASCPQGPVEWLEPPDGVVDARQPYPIDDPTDLQGIDTITVAAPEGADASCWELCETNENPSLHPPYPPELQNNDILSAPDNGDGTYTIVLKRPITPGEVTTVTHTDDDAGATTGTFISHPANVNGDGFADPLDIPAMIDILNGEGRIL